MAMSLFRMVEVRLLPVLYVVLMLAAACFAANRQTSRDMMSDEANWLRRYAEKTALAQSASLAFEQYLGIPHSHLQSVFPHNAEQDGAILRHLYDRQSRFLEFQAQGKTYFASPWMLGRPGEGAARPGVLLF